MRRENLPITSNTRLCSVHFEGVDLPSTDRQAPKGDPMKFLKISNPRKERLTRHSLGKVIRPETSAALLLSAATSPRNIDGQSDTTVSESSLTHRPVEIVDLPFEENVDEIAALRQENARLREELESVGHALKRLDSVKLSYNNLREKAKEFRFYTGLDVSQFQDILTILGSAPERMAYCERNGTTTERKGRPGSNRVFQWKTSFC